MTRTTPEQQAPRSDRPRSDEGYRFDDPYWDDVFDTLHDPAMRVCSVHGCC